MSRNFRDDLDQSTSVKPSFLQALLTFLAIVTVIGVGLFVLKTSLHALLLICLLIAGGSAWLMTKGGFESIRDAMNSGIARAFNALYIFILIGVLIAAFIQAGTVQTLIYYGLETLEPAWFLPAGLVLCAFMSVATGTSWGTVGTAGLVLIALGSVMSIPLGIVAGMVVSGACFGDKMSPVSDTTNLSAMSSGTGLYTHIRSMFCTTGPTFLLALVIFAFVSMGYSDNAMPLAQLTDLKAGLETGYSISPVTLLPFVVLIGLSMIRVAPELTMMASAIVAVLLAVFYQGADFAAILSALFSGGTGNTGIELLDDLLGRGGISSMMWTLSLAILALAMGGILQSYGFLEVLVSGLFQRARSAVVLVGSTILTCLVGNMTMGEAYMSIILGGNLFAPAYDAEGLDRSVLSRSLEEGATLTTPLIPWTTGGAFFAATLGVDILDYLPWALLNWMNLIVAIVFAAFGIAIFRNHQATS